MHRNTETPHWKLIQMHFQFGVTASRCIYTHTVLKVSQWGPVKLICHSVHPSVPLFGEHSHAQKLCADHAPAGHGFKSPEWHYNMCVCTSGRPQLFWYFFICINFHCGGPVLQWIYFINLNGPRFSLRVTIYVMVLNLLLTLLIYWPAAVADPYSIFPSIYLWNLTGEF